MRMCVCVCVCMCMCVHEWVCGLGLHMDSLERSSNAFSLSFMCGLWMWCIHHPKHTCWHPLVASSSCLVSPHALKACIWANQNPHRHILFVRPHQTKSIHDDKNSFQYNFFFPIARVFESERHVEPHANASPYWNVHISDPMACPPQKFITYNTNEDA